MKDVGKSENFLILYFSFSQIQYTYDAHCENDKDGDTTAKIQRDFTSNKKIKNKERERWKLCLQITSNPGVSTDELYLKRLRPSTSLITELQVQDNRIKHISFR